MAYNGKGSFIREGISETQLGGMEIMRSYRLLKPDRKNKRKGIAVLEKD